MHLITTNFMTRELTRLDHMTSHLSAAYIHDETDVWCEVRAESDAAGVESAVKRQFMR